MPTLPSPSAGQKRLTLLYFNAGGGHRAAAQALAEVIAQQQRPWSVQLVNLFELLDPQAGFQKLTGMQPEDLYNKRLARGWTLGLAQELKLLQGLIRLAHHSLVKPLQQHWLRTEPDLVVSLLPNVNRAIGDSLASSLPGVPFVTVMTDIADHPPHFWIEPDQAQHLVCGSDRAMAQARAAGCAEQRLHRVSGMVLRPGFYAPAPIPAERRADRQRLGLPADGPVGAVMFGGQGAKVMRDIAKALPDQPLILFCGHNRLLAEQLKRLPAQAPRLVLGFTPEVAHYLRLADWFIGKPGPGSLSEAVQLGLPVLTVRNAWTMPQERYNTDWVQEQGLGRVGRSFANIRPEVMALLDQLDSLRAQVARQQNRAVFEVVDILAGLLDQGDGRQPAPLAGMGLVPAARGPAQAPVGSSRR